MKLRELNGIALGVSLIALPSMAGAEPFNPYAAPTNRGPSSQDVAAIGATAAAPGTPYIIPTAPGWSVTSLLTTGNAMADGYRLGGVPDGAAAYSNGDRTITVLINHETASPAGTGSGSAGNSAGHGGTAGGYVSQWVINKDTLQVISGRDFVNTPANFNVWSSGTSSWVAGNTIPGDSRLNIARLCSADMAPTSAFYNAATGLGFNGKIFLNGEEGGGGLGRAFGWVVGEQKAYELPVFKSAFTSSTPNTIPAFENLLANAATGNKTVVMANSDGGSNQVSLYIGDKQSTGNAVEKAGLNNGQVYGIKVAGVTTEDRTTNVGIAKGGTGIGSGTTAAISLATPNNGTTFLRPEDGAWDPRNPNRYLFVTTDRGNTAADGGTLSGSTFVSGAGQVGRSRLWAITFDDINNINTAGGATGRIEMLLNGTEGGDMFDNMSIDDRGIVTLQEDIGNSAHNGKIWTYDTNTGVFSMIFKHDPSKFGDLIAGVFSAPTAPFTTDKETSGVLDVTALFSDAAWYGNGGRVLLAVDQAHFSCPVVRRRPVDAADLGAGAGEHVAARRRAARARRGAPAPLEHAAFT